MRDVSLNTVLSYGLCGQGFIEIDFPGSQAPSLGHSCWQPANGRQPSRWRGKGLDSISGALLLDDASRDVHLGSGYVESRWSKHEEALERVRSLLLSGEVHLPDPIDIDASQSLQPSAAEGLEERFESQGELRGLPQLRAEAQSQHVGIPALVLQRILFREAMLASSPSVALEVTLRDIVGFGATGPFTLLLPFPALPADAHSAVDVQAALLDLQAKRGGWIFQMYEQFASGQPRPRYDVVIQFGRADTTVDLVVSPAPRVRLVIDLDRARWRMNHSGGAAALSETIGTLLAEEQAISRTVLRNIFSNRLGRRLGGDEDLFQAGLNSLMVMGVVADAASAGLRVSPNVIYTFRTIDSIAQALGAQ